MKMLWKICLCAGLLFSCGTAGAVSSLVADAESGYMFVRFQDQEALAPASLTKLMTLYLTFYALDAGWLNFDDELPISEYAASQPRTNLDLIAGQTITVRQAVDGLIVHSANDAAVVLAEALGGSEEYFSDLMTQTARQLMMYHTVFKNASGLHDPEQQTTAQDMAILALALINHFPTYYPLFSQTGFSYNGRDYTSHNHVLQDYDGAEGMKTGYVSAVGYNLITTAKRKGRRLVGVVMGYDSVTHRDDEMKQLLDQCFHRAYVQSQAVADGRLNTAFDPLHRRFMLQKANLSIYAGTILRAIDQAKKRGAEKVDISTFNIAHNKLQAYNMNWSVQVGAFLSNARALAMAQRAVSLLGVPGARVHTQPAQGLYRAQITGFLSYEDAASACVQLKERLCPCFVVSD